MILHRRQIAKQESTHIPLAMRSRKGKRKALASHIPVLKNTFDSDGMTSRDQNFYKKKKITIIAEARNLVRFS